MINLLPNEVKESVRFARINVILMQYIFILIAVIGLITVLMLQGKQSLESTKRAAEERITLSPEVQTEISDVANQARELSDTVNVIGQIFENEVKYSLVLQEIGSVIPSGVRVTSLNLREETDLPFRLTVQLETAELAGVLQQNIIESRIFSSADILQVARNQTDTGTKYNFSAELDAFFDPSVPLKSIDDLIEEPESAETSEQEEGATQ